MIFNKMVASKNKNSQLQSGQRYRNNLWKSYFFDYHLRKISKKIVKKFENDRTSRFVKILLTDFENVVSKTIFVSIYGIKLKFGSSWNKKIDF